MPTPAEMQAASAEWLAVNRPDLVNAPATTAQQAEQTNQAWRNNTLPIMPAIAPTASNIDYSNYSQQQREAIYDQGGSNLILTWQGGSSEVQGKAVYLTPAEYQQQYGMTDAEAEQQKYNIFNNPMAVDPSKLPANLLETYGQQMQQNVHEYYMANPSPEFLAITEQYNATRFNTITGGGIIFGSNPGSRPRGKNPFGSDNALAIAWEVAGTGGATDFNLNLIAEAEGRQLGVDTSFIRFATDIYMERPSFAREVLTTKTGQQFTNKEWTGVPIRLNLTMDEIVAGGGITKENYGKFLQYDDTTHLLTRITSPGVSIGIDPGVHKAFGDFGGPILKDGAYGGWRPGSRLVGGKTLASQAAFSDIVNGTQPQTGSEVMRPSDFDLEVLRIFGGGPISGGLIQISDFWFGGRTTINTKTGPKVFETGPTVTKYREILPGVMETTTTTTSTGKQDIFTTTTPIKSGFEFMQSDISNQMFSGVGSLFGVSGEQVKTGMGIQAQVSREMANNAPTPFYLGTAMGSAQLFEGLNKPIEAAVNVGIGIAFGAGFKGLEAGVTAGRAATAEKIISSGGAWRAAEMVSGGAMKYAPPILGSLYAADVAGRSTNWFSDFRPGNVAAKGSTILAYESLPMGAGFVAGYSGPGAVYKGLKIADINYLSAKQEGMTTGRFDYFVKQPVSKPYNLEKINYQSYIQEGRGATLTDYAAYRIQKPIAETTARIDVGLEKLFHPSRFKGVEGTENLWQPRSTLNIWGREQRSPSTKFSIGGKEPSKPSGFVEVKSSGGMVQLARMEQRPVFEQMPRVETDMRGMPVHPRGPEPFSRQRYNIEEETQYFPLPPGMVSPGPKQSTITQITQLSTPMMEISRLTMPMTEVSLFSQQRQRYDQMPGIMQESRQRQFVSQMSRQDMRARSPLFDQRSSLDLFSGQREDTRSMSGMDFQVITTPFQESRTRTDQITKTRQDEITRPFQDQITRTHQDIFGGGGWPLGGGGARQAGWLGVRTWKRNNLVATAPYLAKGMIDPFSRIRMKKKKRGRGPFG